MKQLKAEKSERSERHTFSNTFTYFSDCSFLVGHFMFESFAFDLKVESFRKMKIFRSHM